MSLLEKAEGLLTEKKADEKYEKWILGQSWGSTQLVEGELLPHLERIKIYDYFLHLNSNSGEDQNLWLFLHFNLNSGEIKI